MALMIIVAAIVMGATFLTLSSFNAAAMKADRYRVTQQALNEAKAALIAYAVSDPNRPGSLPCPDANNDGRSQPVDDYSGSVCTTLIGRLPWITLGLPDLRDASGEPLWYAVSADFQANSTVPLNSDTAFRTGNASLSIVGSQPAGNLAAIVFAPGPTLRRADNVAQSRTCPGAGCSVASNFLDIFVTDNADANTIFIASDESLTFNDRLLPVYSDDIMPLVEKRAGLELARYLRAHFDAWRDTTNVAGTKGFYPWAAPFSDPSVTSAGVSGTTAGLLPMSAASVVWTVATPTLGTCTGVGTTQIECAAFVVCIFGACLFDIDARVGNIGTAFVDPPVAPTISAAGWPLVIGTPSITWTLNAATQTLRLSFSLSSLLGATGLGIATVTANAPAASAWTTSSWLATNNWKQVSYYALSQRFALTGSNDCLVPAQCLTVTNGVTATANREAVVMTTGRALPLLPQASPRPAGVASLANYLEAENLAPVDVVFQQGMRSSQFNDQPVAVRP